MASASCPPPAADWMRLLWQTTAHLVTTGASLCGVSRCLPDQWTPDPDARRCRRCRAKAGEPVTPWPWRVQHRPETFAGVDPLVHAIRAYQNSLNERKNR